MKREPGRPTYRRRSAAALGMVLTVLAAAGLAGPSAALAQAPRTITLQAPARGATVASPVEVRGRVTVSPFENNLRGRVYDASGRVVGEGPVAVTPDVFGSLGGPGSFTARLPFSVPAGGPGRVEVADLSAADGSLLASASVDVVLRGPVALPRTGAGPARTPGNALLGAAGLASVALLWSRWRLRDRTLHQKRSG